MSATTCEASSPNPSEADILKVPVALVIEKLLSPILAKVIPDGLPIALFNPSRIALVSVFDEVNVVVVPSIVIEYGVLLTPCNTE